MQDLEVMLQRLEFASVAFREVMGQLRQRAGRARLPRPCRSGRRSSPGAARPELGDAPQSAAVPGLSSAPRALAP